MQSGGVWAYQPMADMSQEEFRDWQMLLEERSGLVVTDQRRTFLQTNLSARMRELSVSDYASYYRQVTDGPRGAVEWSHLMDRLTVQETRFLRHPASYALLQEHLQQRLDEHGLSRPWNLWSVGCASGEEPYSMALLADQLLSDQGYPLHFGVHATDLSLSALSKAREGLYSARKLEPLSPEQREQYFERQADGCFKVSKSLAARLCCARLNVLELANAPLKGMDVIFCQNVLIYFRRWRRREILNRLAERLAPGGLLVLGVGEIVGWQHPDLDPVANEHVLAFIRKSL